MNTFTLEIFDDEGTECTFYTVRLDTEQLTETDKFFLRYEKPSSLFHEEAQKLLVLILELIGDVYGALDDFFDRFENKAQALPPKPGKVKLEIMHLGANFPLRLYCYRISDSIVVLFNGGIKDADTAQESGDLSMKFRDAQQYAQKISKAIYDKMIVIEHERVLKTFDNNSEIVL